jgi:AcrR family transcriptional regulator
MDPADRSRGRDLRRPWLRNASIEQLCADANISTRNFYEEFASKEHLLVELHDIVNHRTLGAVAEAVASVDDHDIEAIAAAGVAAYFKSMTSDRRWARIALVESVGVSREMEAHRRSALDAYAAVITLQADALAAAGLIPSRNFGLTALAPVGAIQELVTMAVARDEASGFDDVAAEATRLVLVALSDPRTE